MMRVVLLSLHMCVVATATRRSKDGYLLPCGFLDGENVCTASDGKTVSIPCGPFTPHFGMAYTYYMLGSTEPLAEGITEYLALNVSSSHNGQHVCCKPNVSANMADYPCYLLNITYAPIQVQVEWPRGYNKWPIIGEPYGLICPLEGNPNATYQWKKYKNSVSFESVDITSDVIFSHDGRSWHVESYSKQDNGLYVCNATNAFGTKSSGYSDNFFLTTEICFGNRLPKEPIIDITPQSSSNYPEGSTVVLLCTALFTDYNTQKPSWYKTNDFMDVYCDGPGYRQTSNYDDVACKWSNNLTIFNFTESHSGKYMCGFFNHTKTVTLNLTQVYLQGQNRDEKSLTVVVPVISVIVAFLLLVLIAVVLIKLASKLRLPSYTRSKEPPYSGFVYDVFISAHDEAREFVQEQILLPLEQQCSPPYKVCWHLRDFIAGIPITEQIADAVLRSRKIIFVFSANFMNSTFCQIELRQSLHRLSTTHTRCIVPIALSDQCVPKKIKNLLTYWPIIPADEDEMMEKICHFLGFPMEEIVIDREDETLLQ